ncbi:MAG: hypothetical protein KA152_14325 [Verrucomicrobiales bacterium]|nr:hypothetical protein [Verrucomicrobiales bacterium]HQW27985.1 hypothetical protein [Verrucomicrobiales bacterium]
MKKVTLLLTLFALVSAGSGLAGEWSPPSKGPVPLPPPSFDENCLSYDFIDLDYINRDFGSQYFSKGQGYGAGFSKSISSSLYINGSYSFGEFEDVWCGCFDVAETHKYRLGAGVRKSIADCVDLTFEGGAEYLDTDYATKLDRGSDSWGYYVGPGIRARAGRFEMFANSNFYHREGDYSQNHIDQQFRSTGYSNDPYGWRISTGFIYHVSERFGVKVAGEFEKYDSALLLGGRFMF